MEPEPTQPTVGIALLNAPTALRSGGWACLPGSEPFKFSSLESLREAGGIWITSASEGTFLTDGGGDMHFLRHAGFFSTPLIALSQELGALGVEPTPQAVERLSEVAHRVLTLTAALCGGSSVDYLGGSSASTLVHEIQKVVAPGDASARREQLPDEVSSAFATLFKPPSPMGQSSASDLLVRIPACRLRIAQSVFNAAIPSGTWSELNLRDQATAEATIRTLIAQALPAFALVTVRGVLPRVKAAAPMTRNFTQGANRWVALPELVALSRVVELVPRRVYVASDLLPVQATIRVPPPVFSPAASASVSASLLAEAYMHALCLPTSSFASKADPSASELPAGSIRSAWLTSIARAHMIQEAMSLGEAGFAVVGCNLSNLLVAVSRRNLRALRKAVAASSFLSYPAGLRPKEETLSMDELRTRIAADLGCA